MTLHDLLPTKKVTSYLLGGAITVAGFWVLIEAGILADWPDAWVMASFAIIVGFLAAWVVPEKAWKRAQEQLTGTVHSDSGDSTEVEGDVTLTPTGQGTADIEGEVSTEDSPQNPIA